MSFIRGKTQTGLWSWIITDSLQTADVNSGEPATLSIKRQNELPLNWGVGWESKLMAKDARSVKHFFSLDGVETHFDVHEGDEQMRGG